MFCFYLIDAALIEGTNLAKHLGTGGVIPTLGPYLLLICMAPTVGTWKYEF